MSAITFSGLATGLDTASIVSQLVEIKRQPIYRLQSNQNDYRSQISALDTLKTKLLALQTAAQELDSANEFASLTASSSSKTLLTATAGTKAAAGSYDIVVHTLAQSQRDLSQGFDSKSDSVGTGSITFTVDGETTTLDLAGYNSLESLKNLINNDVAGVNASIINDGSASGGYKLMLSSDTAGSSGAYTVDMSGLSGGTTPLLTNQQTATDASLTVNGVDVVATSNNPTDVISGLTLNLIGADDATTVHIDVTRDTEGISDKVEAMVGAYNDLFSYIKDQSGSTGTLHGNTTLSTVSSRIENMFVSGLSDGLGDITNFFQVGITRGSDRQLVFSQDDFETALADDYSGVRDLFIEREGNLGKMYLLDTAIEDLTDSIDGVFKISTDSLNRKIDYADDTIARYERSVETYQSTMEAKFTAMERMVAQLQAQGNYLSSFSSVSY